MKARNGNANQKRLITTSLRFCYLHLFFCSLTSGNGFFYRVIISSLHLQGYAFSIWSVIFGQAELFPPFLATFSWCRQTPPPLHTKHICITSISCCCCGGCILAKKDFCCSSNNICCSCWCCLYLRGARWCHNLRGRKFSTLWQSYCLNQWFSTVVPRDSVRGATSFHFHWPLDLF